MNENRYVVMFEERKRVMWDNHHYQECGRCRLFVHTYIRSDGQREPRMYFVSLKIAVARNATEKWSTETKREREEEGFFEMK